MTEVPVVLDPLGLGKGIGPEGIGATAESSEGSGSVEIRIGRRSVFAAEESGGRITSGWATVLPPPG
jgi:hypothetical protein